MMYYLLCHTSIFLPIPCGKYQQVAGPPVSGLITGSPKHISVPESWNVSYKKGSNIKRRHGNEENSSHKEQSCDVPWRLSGSQAHTLGDTIMSLVPAECFCKIEMKNMWTCLHCCFNEGRKDNPLSYLLRPDDPDDYQTLLNQSFVVVPDNAPQISSGSSSASHWSQCQIVRRTIETILAEHPGSSNMLCCGYDKESNDLSPIMKLLISPPWDLALQRIGERLMSYLLSYTSIFVPTSCGKYQQIAGSPLSILNTVSKKKRRRENVDYSSRKKQSCLHVSQIEGPQNSSGLICNIMESRSKLEI